MYKTQGQIMWDIYVSNEWVLIKTDFKANGYSESSKENSKQNTF